MGIFSDFKSSEKKRGRHKKDCTCENCIAKRNGEDPPEDEPLGSGDGDISSDEFSDDQGGGEEVNDLNINEPISQADIEAKLNEELKSEEESETEVAGKAKTEDPEENLPEFLESRITFSASFVLILLDQWIPKGIIWAAKEFGYKTDKKPSDLRLTEKEINELTPLTDAIIKKYLVHLTIEQQFIIGIISAYASKL